MRASVGNHSGFGTWAHLHLKVFIQAFLVGMERKKAGKTWVIGFTGCFLLVPHFLRWTGETWQACQIFFTVAVMAKLGGRGGSPSGNRGGEHRWSNEWKDASLWKWNLSAQPTRFGEFDCKFDALVNKVISLWVWMLAPKTDTTSDITFTSISYFSWSKTHSISNENTHLLPSVTFTGLDVSKW